jgi:hypothetical protein
VVHHLAFRQVGNWMDGLPCLAFCIPPLVDFFFFMHWGFNKTLSELLVSSRLLTVLFLNQNMKSLYSHLVARRNFSLQTVRGNVAVTAVNPCNLIPHCGRFVWISRGHFCHLIFAPRMKSAENHDCAFVPPS